MVGSMARIRSLKETVTDNSRLHPTEVDCTWQTTRTANGEVFVTLSTYGSDHRVSHPKVSQTIQLDREIAAELVRVLTAAFEL